MALTKRERELQARADAYFDACEARPPTLSGLSLALGIERAALVGGRYRGPGQAAVMQAYLRYEEYLERRLHDKDGYRGAEFCLQCNCGWEKQPPQEGDQMLMEGIRELLGSVGDGHSPQ